MQALPMSGLSLINGYSSSSEDSDTGLYECNPKRPKLQPPDLSKVLVVSTITHLDDPSLHKNRIRSFPHVRGNWATFVYVKYPDEESLNNFTNRLLAKLHSYGDVSHRCDDFHLSLSKTVVLQYHLITTFKESLQEAFCNIQCFFLDFSNINIYCNEDNTRTFISLDVDRSTKVNLIKLIQKVDGVLEDYRLPLFYENPSFHISVLWFNGNQKDKLTQFLEEFNHTLMEEIENTIKPVLVSHLNCKIGNKYFQFRLEETSL